MAKDVWIAIPAYTGQIHLSTMRSILTDLLVLKDRGDSVTIFDESGNALIADCRALIVAKFLESGASDLVFVDSDVCWEAGALVKLLDHPVDFVAGIYPQRRDPINFSVSWVPDREELWADEKTGLIEVAGVPAGFMRVTRNMLLKMVAQYTDTAFHCNDAPDSRAYALFDPYRIGVMKLGEDYAFCRRWRDIGGKVWIDPDIRMGHVGFKTFDGHIGNWLKNRAVT